jgi:multisubunit Na+/H+ antiporter MnhC subunit
MNLVSRIAVLHSEESSFYPIIFSLVVSFLGEQLLEGFNIREPSEEFFIILEGVSMTREAFRVVLKPVAFPIVYVFVLTCLVIGENG